MPPQRNKEEKAANALLFESNFLSMDDVNGLRIGDKIDYRNDDGKFDLVTILAKKENFIKLHFEQSSSNQLDIWSDFKQELHRFAKANSISNRRSSLRQTFQRNDFVDIKPPFEVSIYQFSAWKYGQINEFDAESDQVKVKLYYSGHTFWTHLDNKSEIAPFKSKPRSKLCMPYPQTTKRSKQIVDQLILDSEKQFIGQIPPEISEQMMLFYHHSCSFPIFTNYEINDSLRVYHENNWILCKVISKTKSKIFVRGVYNKRDAVEYNLDLVNDRNRIRYPLEHRWNLQREFERLYWSKRTVADGQNIFGCFAHEIFDDMSKSEMIQRQCSRYISDNIAYFEQFRPWKMIIIALSELYNVKTRIFQFDEAAKELFMAHEYGVCEETAKLPLVMLLEQNEYYHIIRSPNLKHIRPLNKAQRDISPQMSMLEFRQQ